MEIVERWGRKGLNLPNLITISRFILIPVYIAFFLDDHLYTAFGILVLAGLTDIADGYLARKRKQITVVGTLLDPLADKTMMLVVMLSLLWAGSIPWSAAIAICIRDLGMIIGSTIFHFKGKLTVPANVMGKLTTALYYIAIIMIFFELPGAIPYLWFVIIVSFLTSIIYIFQFSSLNKSQLHK
jgi:cardiolipin synthase